MELVPLEYLKSLLTLVDLHKVDRLDLPQGISIIKTRHPFDGPSGGPGLPKPEPTSIEELDAEVAASFKG